MAHEQSRSRQARQVRLFVGARISMASMESLAETAEAMRRDAYEGGYQIRWVAPANYHITLKFLGSADPEIITAIRDRIEPGLAAVPAFAITAASVGAFPDARNARVIWAGVDDPAGGLSQIAGILEGELADLGFRRDKRRFHAHITLGRVKRVDDVSQVLAPYTERTFRSCDIKSAILFESVIKPSGSEYVTRARFALGTALSGRKRHTEPLQRAERKAPDSKGAPASEPSDPAMTGAAPEQDAPPSAGAEDSDNQRET